MALDLSETDSDCAAMVAERNLGEFFLDNASNLAIEEAIQKLTHIRLDRERLQSLDLCHYLLTLPILTNLYLQENELESLKGLEMVKNLRFLTVSGNHLTKLDYLSSLSELMVLDVSSNDIMRINAKVELPKSLSFLNVVGNPCCIQQCDLRGHLKTELPNLKELNGDPLTDDECTSESESLENTLDNALNDQNNCINNNHDELTCNEDQERTCPSFISPRESCTTNLVVQRIGTPSFTSLVAHCISDEGSNPLPMSSPTDMRSRDVEDLKDCLLKANPEPEFAVQKVLAMTTGSLDYPTMAILERVEERANNFDGKLSQEILNIFFSSHQDHLLNPRVEISEPTANCEAPGQGKS